MNRYLVLCRADRKANGDKGDYELATRREFKAVTEAIKYCNDLSTSRHPIVVKVIYNGDEYEYQDQV